MLNGQELDVAGQRDLKLQGFKFCGAEIYPGRPYRQTFLFSLHKCEKFKIIEISNN